MELDVTETSPGLSDGIVHILLLSVHFGSEPFPSLAVIQILGSSPDLHSRNVDLGFVGSSKLMLQVHGDWVWTIHKLGCAPNPGIEPRPSIQEH